MAKKPTLTDIATMYNAQTFINANNDAIEAAFENTLSLDGSTPNALSADIDLDGNDLLNVGTLFANDFAFNGGGSIDGYLTDAEAAATASAASASAAATSATNAATSESNASDSADEAAASALSVNAANLLQVVNNLSDLGSVTTARTNLGLGTAALENFTDDDNLSTDPDNIGTRGNVQSVVDDIITTEIPGATSIYKASTGSSQTFDETHTQPSPAIYTIRQNVTLSPGGYEIAVPIELLFVGSSPSSAGTTRGIVKVGLYEAGTTTQVFSVGSLFFGHTVDAALFPRNQNDGAYTELRELYEIASETAVDIYVSAYTISAASGDDFDLTIGAPKVQKITLVS